jgi:glycosyltransferase involved in cell wall biosynthesis
MIEAMLAGCAVLTTGSGGAMEIAKLADLPLFPKEDPVALNEILTHLVTHRSEISRIASRGQAVALREFSFDWMMERWTTTLRRLHEDSAGPFTSGGSSRLHHRPGDIPTGRPNSSPMCYTRHHA